MDIEQLFFNGWANVFRTIIVGIFGYLALVSILRISGKRTLSKMNAFDLVVTVALGSTLATILLSKDVALLEGLTAFLVLIGMQYAIAWLSVRSTTISGLVKSEPQLLVFQGQLLHGAMRAERVVEPEILAAVRQQGSASLETVAAVVLETDGSFTVIQHIDNANPAALTNVAGYEQHAR